MPSTHVQVYDVNALQVTHHRNENIVFLSVHEATQFGFRVTLTGTVDDLTSLLARMAEQVDNADKAIMAAKSEPLPMDVSA